MNRRTLLRLSIPAVAAATVLPNVGNTQAITVTPSSGNVFEDAGLPDAQHIRDLVTGLLDNAFWALPASKLDQVLSVLHSNQFRCVGFLSDEQRYWGDPGAKGHYDDRDRCTEMLRVSIESEYGEYGAYLGSALVFDGLCAEYHGYRDDSQNYRDLSERYAERKSLLTQVKAIVNESMTDHA